jgi:hypothetical protein
MNKCNQHPWITIDLDVASNIERGGKRMEQFSNKRGLSCQPVQWITEGHTIVHDEQHAFRYEVRDERGQTFGFITADRAMCHPDVKWQRSLLRDEEIEELVGKYATVYEALAAF